ncbi:PhaM family polyhydroxyalkanoate granule multifunctional regulatory protein [Ottowia sp.]|jgi:DNA polymerase III gamma/tau subunit|uniref:PhaM family polyhydroxyalkanoate granule multifunctional regulatory protein n=1 Tax=Ottowia sp. TaxID=1898956 RepID=UPI0025E31B05|nr:PhaM family polyhydroxyalkanoate granule multifunctional regulatory protein [Ottowia sp.]MBK6615241.1 hypothetical protein [Ottowia sp.]MBK6746316.1 hypothetical protein [Ottowia sp.]
MSDDNTFALGKLIPGFDFLQQLTSTTKGASKSAPGLRHWIAPTVSVEELDKRITELRAVQFWLEQNLLALKATIQALEVQKMTLATLRDMNLSVTEVAKAFTLPKSEERAAPAAPPAEETAKRWPYKDKGAASAAKTPAEAAAPTPEAEPAEPAQPPAAAAPRARAGRKDAAASSGGVADPMQWWGALTQQFQQIAAETLREAARAVPAPAGEASGADAAPQAEAAQPAAKKSAPRKSAAKKAAKRKAPAKKAAAKKTPAKKASPARPLAAGWPLPTPFKLGRR